MNKIGFFRLKCIYLFNRKRKKSSETKFCKNKTKKTYSANTEGCAPPVRAIPTLIFFNRICLPLFS